jgi:hypothetical protein
MSRTFAWKDGKTPADATDELVDEYLRILRAAIFQLAQQFAPQIEAWMKANRPWKDRTSNARQTLQAEAVQELTEIAIRIFHGVDYGVYLELSNQGKYSILGPALDYWSVRFWNAVKRIVEP